MAKTKEAHKKWVARNYKKYREITNRCKRAWDLKNPDKVRAHKRAYDRKHGLHYYNITEVEYQKLCKQQSGKCAICRNEDTGKRLSVDHDHVTGDIRGLLCSACNLGLGLFKDKSDLLIEASEYILKSRKRG